jgi:hypothetical protein
MDTPTIDSKPLKPAQKIPNKFVNPEIEKYPVYNALQIGFNALNGKTNATDLQNKLQDLQANTRTFVQEKREKLKENRRTETYNTARKLFFVGSALATAAANELKFYEVDEADDFVKDEKIQ